MNEQQTAAPKAVGILEVADAMARVQPPRPWANEPLWWLDPDINRVLYAGVAAGYVSRCSTTQVCWTEAGAAAAKTALAEKERQAAQPYLIFSQSEAEATTIREGFWSNEHGWTDFTLATCFTAEEQAKLSLPVSAGGDAKWITAESMAPFFKEMNERVTRLPGTVVKVDFASTWKEGTVTTTAKLDLSSGAVFDVDQSGEDAGYRSLVMETVEMYGVPALVIRGADGSRRVGEFSLGQLRQWAPYPVVTTSFRM